MSCGTRLNPPGRGHFGAKRADSVEGVLDLAAGHVAVLRVGAEGDEVLTRHVHLERQTPGGLRGRGAAVPPPRRRPRRASTVDCVPQLVCHLSTQRRLLLQKIMLSSFYDTIFLVILSSFFYILVLNC